MTEYDVLFIAYSGTTGYEVISEFPLERLELFRQLVFPKMLYYEGKFRSQLDMVNRFYFGKYFADASYEIRRDMINVWNLPSFAGLYLSQLLRDNGIRCGVINHLDAEFDLFVAMYRQSPNPPLVALSTTFHLNWASIQRVIKQLHQIDPKMRIVLGGAMLATNALTESPAIWEKFLDRCRCEAAFFAMNSEFDLLAYFKNRDNKGCKAVIPNLVWSDQEERYHCNPTVWHNPLVDRMPIDWTALQRTKSPKTLQIRTAVGCPFSCRFCSYPVLSHGLHSIAIGCLEQALEAAVAIPSIQRVVFLDDTLNVPKKRFQNIVRLMSKNRLQWSCFLRPQFIEADTARMMADSGCQMVSLGIESGSDLILNNMNKLTCAEDMAKGIGYLRAAGIITAAFFIIGFPGETRHTLQQTAEFIVQSGVNYYMLKDFFHIPATGMNEIAAHFKLTGIGNKWQHSTMSSSEAANHKESMYLTTTSAEHLDPDLGMWQLVAMQDAGFSTNEIYNIQKMLNAAIKRQMSDKTPNASAIDKAILEDLVAITRERTMGK